MLTPIVLLIIGLLIGVTVKGLTRYVHLPYTVLLFAVGIVLGLLSKGAWVSEDSTLTEGIRLISTMNPDFILYVFLPILVFDAAYEMDLHVFRKTLFNASLLAGPGVVICMLLTAGMVMGIVTLWSGYDPKLWPFALMFGGLISATDPVAVVALLQELGTKKRFSTLVDGESLLNDGTGLVCFMMFYSAYAGMGNIDHPLEYFVWVVFASSLIGLFFARVAIRTVKNVLKDEVLQNCVMLIGAYLTFMLAQKAFDVSGVIALVVFGQVFAQAGRPHLKPETNEWMGKFWGLLAYIANTLIFLIVGIIIATRVEFSWLMLGGIVLVFVGLNLIRYIMILVLIPILKRNGYGLNWREFVILGWGGLRGALGMCMALMVSCNPAIPENIRMHILVYTAGVVTLTLCVNATTSKFLVGKLRLIDPPSNSERHISQQMLQYIQENDQRVLTELHQNPYLEKADWSHIESKMIFAPPEAENSTLSEDDLLCVMRRCLLAHIEKITNDYYHNGTLQRMTHRHILGTLAELNDYEGQKPLDSYDLKQSIRRERWTHTRRQYLLNGSNLCRGYVIIFTESRDFIGKTIKTGMMNLQVEQTTIDTLQSELDHCIQTANTLLEDFHRIDPELFAEGVTDKATRVLLAAERAEVDRLLQNGIMTQDQADEIRKDISKRQGMEIVD